MRRRPGGDGRLERNRLAERRSPQLLARIGRQAEYLACRRADEDLAVDQRRRRQRRVHHRPLPARPILDLRFAILDFRVQVDLSAVEDRGGDDLSGDRLFPVLLAGLQVEADKRVMTGCLAVGMGHVNPAAGDGGHAHQRVAQPFLPDACAVDGEDLQFTALGVEGDS